MKTETLQENTEDVTETLPKNSLGIKKFVTYAILVLLVFISAMMVVFQIFEYRNDFRQLNSYMREKEDINAEWGRLLIEQQTFGATAQIGTRAVTQLRMYSPPAAQTVVISLPMTSQQKN
nr:cell division protein FtsL [Acinetobacter sp. Marseille-Q1620]